MVALCLLQLAECHTAGGNYDMLVTPLASCCIGLCRFIWLKPQACSETRLTAAKHLWLHMVLYSIYILRIGLLAFLLPTLAYSKHAN